MQADPIPVAPAYYYSCGGISYGTRLFRQKLKGLYACGEVACTGLHGANRLASNSLLEAVVMAHWGAEAVCIFWNPAKNQKFPCLDGWTVMSLHRMNALCSPTTSMN